ncbi:unnamed protein product [Ophioblennius macclurei]
MQDISEPCRRDDDMADGDLGDGMRTGAVPGSLLKKTLRMATPLESLLLRSEPRLSSQHAESLSGWTPTLKITEAQNTARWKLPHLGCETAGSLTDWSKDKLREKLREAVEVIDALCCELEVTHRYLEGKYEALKILQGKAILDKATSHTKSLLQKSEEKAKALEKEINSLQWELSFQQLQTKKSEQSWEHKYSRTVSENKALTEQLAETQNQVQQLGVENFALRRQYLELFSMLNVREQRIYQGTKPQYSPERDASMLELSVLGACRCFSVTEVCACSRTAAASRKQLVQLQQELSAQRSRMEEAVMVADAFRIAFEQQLRKRSEHFLLLAEANVLKPHHWKPEGVSRSPLISVGQKLRDLLPSSLDVKMPEELLETLYRLLDLLNDKEEALAHQRKVSIMLAHSAEELEKQLHLDEPSDPSGWSKKQEDTSGTLVCEEVFSQLKKTLKNPSDWSEKQNQETSESSLAESKVHTKLKTKLLDSSFQTECIAGAVTEPGTKSRTETLKELDSSQTDKKPVLNHENHKKQENHESHNS